MLMLTSHSVGAARGSDRAVDHMVICIGDQTEVIHVDADGAPVSVPHHCPDCALHGLDVVAPRTAGLGAAPVYAHHAAALTDVFLSGDKTPDAHARAPPALI